MNNEIKNLIYGIDATSNVVCIEPNDSSIEIFIEKDGKVQSHVVPNFYWILCPQNFSGTTRLQGDQYYKHIRKFTDRDAFINARKKGYKADCWSIFDPKESYMVMNGLTYYKDMKVEDTSVLSFDIETTGIVHNKNSKVLLISNTLLKQGKIIKKLFAYDEYDSEKDFIDAWTLWVRENNPSTLVGHNIFGFDLKYLDYFAQMSGTTLKLGRDGSDIKFNEYVSKFRKDGSQSYDYNNAYVYGRELVDTFFLSLKSDVKRKYESYGLKQIIDQEGLQKVDRQFYDAATIKDNYMIPEEWEKIKAYAKDDADDALALYKLMIPSFFYLAQSVPKSFQSIINSATGSQINSVLVRSYLQLGQSIPKASDVQHFEGGLSMGIPGIYKNCKKLDIVSAYPSTILQYELYDKTKDPNAYLLKMTDYFFHKRIEYKKLSKENKYYKDMDATAKIFLNSIYGTLGAPGLAFNSPYIAAKITNYCRSYLEKAIMWATGQNSDYWKAKADTSEEENESA